jgi:AcrR family transcriptional regulator
MIRDARFHNRKERLAAAAFRVLAEEGFEAFSFRAVAQAAGCSLGRVVHYYPTKQDLLLGAVRQTGSPIRAELETIEHANPAAEALEATLRCALPTSDLARAHWRVWAGCWARAAYDRQVGQLVRLRHREWQARVARLIERAQIAGVVREVLNIEIAVGLITTSVAGVGMMALREDLPPEAQISLLNGCMRAFQVRGSCEES